MSWFGGSNPLPAPQEAFEKSNRKSCILAAGKLFESQLTVSDLSLGDKLGVVRELRGMRGLKTYLSKLNEREKRELVKKLVEELKRIRSSWRISDRERELMYTIWKLAGRWPLWELGYSANTIFKHVSKARIEEVDGWLEDFLEKKTRPRRPHLKGKLKVD